MIQKMSVTSATSRNCSFAEDDWLDIVASVTRSEKFLRTNFNEAGRSVTSGQNRSKLNVRLARVLKIT
jgi:hypothetical protein